MNYKKICKNKTLLQMFFTISLFIMLICISLLVVFLPKSPKNTFKQPKVVINNNVINSPQRASNSFSSASPRIYHNPLADFNQSFAKKWINTKSKFKGKTSFNEQKHKETQEYILSSPKAQQIEINPHGKGNILKSDPLWDERGRRRNRKAGHHSYKFPKTTWVQLNIIDKISNDIADPATPSQGKCGVIPCLHVYDNHEHVSAFGDFTFNFRNPIDITKENQKFALMFEGSNIPTNNLNNVFATQETFKNIINKKVQEHKTQYRNQWKHRYNAFDFEFKVLLKGIKIGKIKSFYYNVWSFASDSVYLFLKYAMNVRLVIEIQSEFSQIPKTPKLTSKDFAPLITPLKNSAQEKKFQGHMAHSWTSAQKPPKLHLGFNSDLLSALIKYNQIYKKVNHRRTRQKLKNLFSSNIVTKIIDYVKKGRIDAKIYENILKKRWKDKEIENYLKKLPILPWYEKYQPASIEGLNIFEYYSIEKLNLIRHFIQKSQKIEVTYFFNDKPTKPQTNTFTFLDLVDHAIPLANSDSNRFQASLTIKNLKIYGSFPKNSSPRKKIMTVKPESYEDFSKYRINWDNKTKTIKVYYQPNSISMTANIWIFNLNKPNEKYDTFFNVYRKKNGIWNQVFESHNNNLVEKLIPLIKEGQEVPLPVKERVKETLEQNYGLQPKRLFSSFLYPIKFKDNNYQYYSFKLPTQKWNPPPLDFNSDNYLQKWETTIYSERGVETLAQILNRDHKKPQIFNRQTLIPVTNQHLQLIVNPYQKFNTENPNKPYYENLNRNFQMKSVVDVIDDQTITLADFTKNSVSNLFSNAFGIERSGKPNGLGFLSEGMHHIKIQMANQSSVKSYFNVYIDLTKPKPTFLNIENDQPLFFKTKSFGKTEYYPLVVSTEEVQMSLVEKGLKHSSLEFINSKGKWFAKDLPIVFFKNEDIWMQKVDMKVDYQGLFRFVSEDLAGNKSVYYLWIQKKPPDQPQTFIATAEPTDTSKKKLVAVSTFKKYPVFWFESKKATTENHLVIKNVLASQKNLNERIFQDGKWKIPTEKSDLILKSPTINSVGNNLLIKEPTNSLAGDELEPLVKEAITSGTGRWVKTTEIIIIRKYHKVFLKLKPGFRRFEINTNIFTYDEYQKKYKPLKTFIYTFLSDKYNTPLLFTQKNLAEKENLFITEYEKVNIEKLNNKFVYHLPTKNPEDSFSQKVSSKNIGQDKWKYLKKGTTINIISKFIEPNSLKILFSPLYHSYYKPVENAFFNSQIHFNSEGRYRISFTDLNKNHHRFQALVFNYPRNFQKKLNYLTIDKNKNKSKTPQPEYLVIQEYEEPPVATYQEKQTYSVDTTFISSNSNLKLKYPAFNLQKEYIYDFQLKTLYLHPQFFYQYPSGLSKSEYSSRDFPAVTFNKKTYWLRVDKNQKKAFSLSQSPTKASPVFEPSIPDDAIEKTEKAFQYILKGKISSLNPLILPKFKKDDKKSTIKTSYKYRIKRSVQRTRPPSIPSGVKWKHHNNPKPLSASELSQTAFWHGDFINLHAATQKNSNYDVTETHIIDHDYDPTTPKIPLYEDYDHFQKRYNLFIAKGGTSEEFWDNEGNPNGDSKDKKKDPPNDGDTKPQEKVKKPGDPKTENTTKDPKTENTTKDPKTKNKAQKPEQKNTTNKLKKEQKDTSSNTLTTSLFIVLGISFFSLLVLIVVFLIWRYRRQTGFGKTIIRKFSGG